MNKVYGTIIISALVAIFGVQLKNVVAAEFKHGPITGPITNPITSPITSPITPTPTCKPGNGFGDKNHCHFGPPGQVNKDHDNDDLGHDTDHSVSHHNSERH